LVAHFAALCLCVKAVPFHDFAALRFSAFLCVLCVKNLSPSIFLPALLVFPFWLRLCRAVPLAFSFLWLALVTQFAE
jgi:hypothetical protein